MVKVAIQLPYHSLVAVLQLLKDSYFIVHVCCQLMYDLYFDEDQSFRSSNNVSQWYRLFLSQNDLSQDKPLIESNTERAIWFQKLGYFLVYSFGSRIVQAIIDQLSIAASLIHVIVISSCDLCLVALELLYGLNQLLPIIPSLYWIIRMMQTNEYLGIPYIHGYSDEDGHLDLDKHPVSVTFSHTMQCGLVSYNSFYIMYYYGGQSIYPPFQSSSHRRSHFFNWSLPFLIKHMSYLMKVRKKS